MRILVLFTLLFFVFESRAQKNIGNIDNNSYPHIEFHVAADLFMIDTDKLPKTREKILAGIGLKLFTNANKAGVNERIGDSFVQFMNKVNTDFPIELGILVRVDYYVGETGQLILDQNILLPLNMGLTPVDALSDYYNIPDRISHVRIQSNFARPLREYIWIYKDLNGNVHIGQIPFSNEFERLAKIVANRKVESVIYPTANYNRLTLDKIYNVAEYWNKKLIEYQKVLSAKNIYQQVKNNTEEFKDLQDQFENTYYTIKQFQRKQEAANSFYKYFALLRDLSTFLPNPEKNSYVRQGNEYASILERKMESLNTDFIKVKMELEKSDRELQELFRKSTKIEYLDKPPIGIQLH